VSNTDYVRKAIPEQLAAFRRFHAKHPASRLFLHTIEREGNSLDVHQLVEYGMPELGPLVVKISDQWRMQTGGFSAEHMRAWYTAMDVIMNVTRGEGFGLPAIEAQACGTPVILAANTTGPELAGPGWTVKCQPWWDTAHASWRGTPLIDDLVRILGEARAVLSNPGKAAIKRAACRVFAEQYSIDRIWPLWKKVIDDAG